jgi:hypothetical protein
MTLVVLFESVSIVSKLGWIAYCSQFFCENADMVDILSLKLVTTLFVTFQASFHNAAQLLLKVVLLCLWLHRRLVIIERVKFLRVRSQ